MIAFIVLGVFACVLVASAACAIWNFRQMHTKLSTIPGPECQLINGNLYLFYKNSMKLSSETFYNTLQAIAKLYRNEGIFKLRLGKKFVVCVFQERHLKGIITSTSNISKSVEYDFLNEWLGNGLLLASSKNWFQKRTFLAKAFHKENLQHFSTGLNQITDQFLAKMVNHDGYLDYEKTFQFTVDAIAGTLLKSQLSKDESATYLECIHQMTHAFTERALNPLLWNGFLFGLTAIGKVYHRNLRVLKRITAKMVTIRHSKMQLEEKSEAKWKRTLADLLLSSSTTIDADSLDQICKEVDTFLFAGHDTTALTINWALYHLGCYPEVQDTLREEIDSEIGPNGQTVHCNHLDRLRCLDSFLSECLRLHPPVPLIGREVSQEFTIGPHTIPRGTMLYILIDQLHLDEHSFPSSHEFIHDRFVSMPKPSSFGYMPFSAGPRNCIGKRYALALIKILLVKVLRTFEIHSEETLDQIELAYNIVLKPKNPLKIRLTRLNENKE